MTAKATGVVIVAAEFNKELVQFMIDTATKELAGAGAELLQVARVAGSYEVPLIVDIHLSREAVDAIVVLGYIERGETLHGEVMGHVVHQTLVDLQLKYRKPIGIGIIGPGATLEQAQQRKASSAIAAVQAALRNCALLAAEG